MKKVIKCSKHQKHRLVFDLTDALYDIGEEYNVSSPVSGDWDSEVEDEMFAIAEAFNISPESAKVLMINELGFDEDLF